MNLRSLFTCIPSLIPESDDSANFETRVEEPERTEVREESEIPHVSKEGRITRVGYRKAFSGWVILSYLFSLFWADIVWAVQAQDRLVAQKEGFHHQIEVTFDDKTGRPLLRRLGFVDQVLARVDIDPFAPDGIRRGGHISWVDGPAQIQEGCFHWNLGDLGTLVMMHSGACGWRGNGGGPLAFLSSQPLSVYGTAPSLWAATPLLRGMDATISKLFVNPPHETMQMAGHFALDHLIHTKGTLIDNSFITEGPSGHIKVNQAGTHYVRSGATLSQGNVTKDLLEHTTTWTSWDRPASPFPLEPLTLPEGVQPASVRGQHVSLVIDNLTNVSWEGSLSTTIFIRHKLDNSLAKIGCLTSPTTIRLGRDAQDGILGEIRGAPVALFKDGDGEITLRRGHITSPQQVTLQGGKIALPFSTLEAPQVVLDLQEATLSKIMAERLHMVTHSGQDFTLKGNISTHALITVQEDGVTEEKAATLLEQARRDVEAQKPVKPSYTVHLEGPMTSSNPLQIRAPRALVRLGSSQHPQPIAFNFENSPLSIQALKAELIKAVLPAIEGVIEVPLGLTIGAPMVDSSRHVAFMSNYTDPLLSMGGGSCYTDHKMGTLFHLPYVVSDGSQLVIKNTLNLKDYWDNFGLIKAASLVLSHSQDAVMMGGGLEVDHLHFEAPSRLFMGAITATSVHDSGRSTSHWCERQGSIFVPGKRGHLVGAFSHLIVRKGATTRPGCKPLIVNQASEVHMFKKSSGILVQSSDIVVSPQEIREGPLQGSPGAPLEYHTTLEELKKQNFYPPALPIAHLGNARKGRQQRTDSFPRGTTYPAIESFGTPTQLLPYQERNHLEGVLMAPSLDIVEGRQGSLLGTLSAAPRLKSDVLVDPSQRPMATSDYVFGYDAGRDPGRLSFLWRPKYHGDPTQDEAFYKAIRGHLYVMDRPQHLEHAEEGSLFLVTPGHLRDMLEKEFRERLNRAFLYFGKTQDLRELAQYHLNTSRLLQDREFTTEAGSLRQFPSYPFIFYVERVIEGMRALCAILHLPQALTHEAQRGGVQTGALSFHRDTSTCRLPTPPSSQDLILHDPTALGIAQREPLAVVQGPVRAETLDVDTQRAFLLRDADVEVDGEATIHSATAAGVHQSRLAASTLTARGERGVFLRDGHLRTQHDATLEAPRGIVALWAGEHVTQTRTGSSDDYTVVTDTQALPSSVISRGTASLSGQHVYGQGAHMSAPVGRVKAHQSIHLDEAFDIHCVDRYQEDSNWLSTETYESHDETHKSLPAHLDGQWTADAPHIKTTHLRLDQESSFTPLNTHVPPGMKEAPKAQLTMKRGEDKHFHASSSTSSNPLWQEAESHQSKRITAAPFEVHGTVDARRVGRAILEHDPREAEPAIYETIRAQAEETILKLKPDLRLEEHHSASGPGPLLNILVSAGIMCATWGAGAACLPAAVSTTTTQAMANTLVGCVAASIPLNVASGRSPLEIFDGDQLRGLICSVASAGILDKLGVTGMTATNLEILKEQMIRSGVHMGLEVAIQGKSASEAFVSALQQCVGNTIQAMGSHALGVHRAEMLGVTHKLGHALLGGVGQGIATGTWEGAASGAVGAGVGEWSAELLIDPAKVDAEVARLTPAFRASHPGATADEIRRMATFEATRQPRLIAEMMAATSTVALGHRGRPAAAQEAANIAITHNTLGVLSALRYGLVGLAAIEIYRVGGEVIEALEEGNIAHALNMVGIEVLVAAYGGQAIAGAVHAGQELCRYAGRVLTRREAVALAMRDAPDLAPKLGAHRIAQMSEGIVVGRGEAASIVPARAQAAAERPAVATAASTRIEAPRPAAAATAETRDVAIHAPADRVRPINGRMPMNHRYAGQTVTFDRLPADIQARYPNLHQDYPHGIPFTGSGLADFSRYARKKIRIEFSRDSQKDIALANRLCGFERTPRGEQWHHHYDGQTMMLVPEDMHRALRHTGGDAIARSKLT